MDGGNLAGKRPTWTDAERALFETPMSVAEVAEFLDIGERTLYRSLARQRTPRVSGKVQLGAAVRAYVIDEREQLAARRAKEMTDDPHEQRAIAEALFRCWQGLPPPPRATDQELWAHS